MKLWLNKHIKTIGLIGIALFMYVIWLFPYFGRFHLLPSSIIRPFEIIGVILIGLAAGLVLSFKKDSYWFTILLVFTPFIFARPFSAKTIPWELIVAVVLAAVGLIVSLVRFKYELKQGPFFIGLALFGISCITGGLFNFHKIYFLQFLVVSFMVIGLLVLFIYLQSTCSISFLDLAKIMFTLGMFITMQCFAYLFTGNSVSQVLSYKGMDLGWGISNNVATIMALVTPFTFYLVLHYQKWKSLFFAILFIPQAIATIFTYSRGGIAAFVLMAVVTYAYGFFVAKDRFAYFLLGAGAIVSVCLIIALGLAFKPDVMKNMFRIIGVKPNDMNSRLDIYKTYMTNLKPNYFFGKGMFEPFNNHFSFGVPNGSNYLWGHGTWIHCLYTTGIFGLIIWLYHTLDKYIFLLKEHSKETMIVFFGFLCSGLYGMIDVSFYFINYMILFIVILSIFKQKKLKGEQ